MPRPLELIVLVFVSLALARAALAQPADVTLEAVVVAQPSANKNAGEVLRALRARYTRSRVVERVTLEMTREDGAVVRDTYWVGVDGPNEQVAIIVGDLRIWAGRAGSDEFAVRVVHARDPVRVFAVVDKSVSLANALWRFIPAIAAPQINLTFGTDPAGAGLWPGLQVTRWRETIGDQAPNERTLIGETSTGAVTLVLGRNLNDAGALRSVRVELPGGAVLRLSIEPTRASDHARVQAPHWLSGKWELAIGPRRVVRSLSELRPLPPATPPLLFSLDGTPVRIRSSGSGAGGDAAMLLINGDADQIEHLSLLAAHIRSIAEDEQTPIVIALATTATGDRLAEALEEWSIRLGEHALWTTGGAETLTQRAGFAADVVLLSVNAGRATTLLALRQDDALADPLHRDDLRAVVKRRLRAARNAAGASHDE